MSSLQMRCAIRFSLASALLVAWLTAEQAWADEKELAKQFSEAVSLVNNGKFAAGRKALDALEQAARLVEPGDPDYKQAQDLLKRAGQERIRSYHNSFVGAANAADDAVRDAKIGEAAEHFKQASGDLTELVRLRPTDKGEKDRLVTYRHKLARASVLEALLAGKPTSEELWKAAGLKEPKTLFQSAPAFSLPRWDKLGLIEPLAETGAVVLVQLCSAVDKEAVLAHATLSALQKQYGSRGLRAVSVSVDEGENLKKLAEFLEAHGPAYEVALDDHGEFRQAYLRSSYYLPSYVLIGRDRRALWIGEQDPLETLAALARQVPLELDKPREGLPGPAVMYYSPAEPIRSSGGQARSLVSRGKPLLLMVTSSKDSAPLVKDLAELAEKNDQLQVAVVIPESGRRVVRDFPEEKSCPLVSVELLPACYGPNYESKLVAVSRGGRVLKIAPLPRDAAHARALFARYAAILSNSESYRAAADAPVGQNLALRAAGGTVESVTSEAKPGLSHRLIDGVCGGEGWSGKGKLPQEVVISFLNRRGATFDQLVIERRTGAGDFEVLVGNEASGPFRWLGKYRFEQRLGKQAFTLPRTEAPFLKIRFLSLLADEHDKPELEIGEISVQEAADVKPPLVDRLADRHRGAVDLKEDFSDQGLKFWEQTDYVSDERPAQWRVEKGWLVQSGADHVRELRASALLSTRPDMTDFRLLAVMKGNTQAGGIVFDFKDWDNFSRLLLVRGHVTGRSGGNSIRLERWREGRLEVLGVHGEAYPTHDSINFEILRHGPRLAVKAKDLVIFSLDDVVPSPGKVGFCGGGGGELEVDEIQVTEISPATPWTVSPVNPLSTAAGASIVWLSSQGTDQEPATWASNLLLTPIFAPAGAWEAKAQDGQPPEVIFALRNHREVLLDAVSCELPKREGIDAKNLVRRIEVLVSRDVPQNIRSFHSTGSFDLVPDSKPQILEFKQPAVCRYVMLRLVENHGGDRYCLGRVGVRLGRDPELQKAVAAGDRGQVEKLFLAPADSTEREPNDSSVEANRLASSKSLEAAIRFGETDWFRLPDPPAGKGLRSLRLRLDALPWLRLTTVICDSDERPLDPPLVKFATGQRVEQTRSVPAGAAIPALLRVEMPPSSLALVLDTSNSMGGREHDLRWAVGDYLRGAAESEQIEVLQFGTNVETLGRLPAQRKSVDEAVSNLGVSGNTALYEALLSAAERNQAIVLLSDGMNTVFKRDFPDLCRELRKKPIPIYVVGVGWDLYEYDPNSGNTAHDLLNNLALQTGGRFYFSAGSEQLAELYGQIAADIRGDTRYRLLAEWELNERRPELASGGGPKSFSIPSASLPPAAPELADISIGTSRRPQLLDLPPAPELASSASRETRPLGATLLPMPLDLELAIRPLPAAPLRGVPLPLVVDLAPSHLDANTVVPWGSPLPEFGQIEVVYRPEREGDPPLPLAVLPATELILDSSDSMKELMGRETKLKVAQSVVNTLVDGLPDDARLGLRLYGHWGRMLLRRADPKAPLLAWEDPRLNSDSELVVPVGPLTMAQRKSLKAWVNWAEPRGKTPLVHSLREAKRDFPATWKGPKTVVLVSDGVETCGGKLADLKAIYGESDVRAVIHVVGFDIRGTDAETQLRAIAEIGAGHYYKATDAKELARALRSALAAGTLVVQDSTGKSAVAGGVVNGSPVVLPPGSYRVSLAGVDLAPQTVTIADGQLLKLKLTDEGRLELP